MPGLYHWICCCGENPVCYYGEGSRVVGDDGVGKVRSTVPWSTANPSNSSAIRFSSCHKLYVWERRTWAAGVPSGSQRPDWVIDTNIAGGTNYGVFGPLDGPFETSQGSGVLLDAEPYWWGCVGGWAVLTEATAVDLDEVTADPAVGTDDPISGLPMNGTYTIAAVLHMREWVNGGVPMGYPMGISVRARGIVKY